MQPLSLERQLARILRMEEEAAELASTVSRPVEQAVIKSLDEHKQLAWEVVIPRERLQFSIEYYTAQAELRTCACCKKRLPRSEFDRAKYSHDKLAFDCRRCQKKNGRKTWAGRVAASQQGRVLPKAA